MYSQLRVSKSCSGLFRSCGGHLPLLQRLSQFPQQIAGDFARASLFGTILQITPFLISCSNSLQKNAFFCFLSAAFLRGLSQSCSGFLRWQFLINCSRYSIGNFLQVATQAQSALGPSILQAILARMKSSDPTIVSGSPF